MAASLPAFPPFDVDSDKTTIGTRWTKWLSKLENFMAAYAITNPDRQKAMLLHFAGDPVFEIASTLDLTPRPADQAANRPAEDAYAATKRVLSSYFCPTNNKEFNIYVFRQGKQGTDESIDQFFARLKKLAAGCEFADLEGEVKSQIIQGCKSSKLRLAALQDHTITLEKLIEKERTIELTKMQALSIEQKTTTEEGSTSHMWQQQQQQETRGRPFGGGGKMKRPFGVRQRHQEHRQEGHQRSYPGQQHQRGKQCPYCGLGYHTEGIAACPARGKRCHSCGNFNHFSAQCMKKKYQQRSRTTGEAKAIEGQEDQVQEDQSSTDGEAAYSMTAFSMANQAAPGQPRVKVFIRGKALSFLVDTGSTVTIIDRWSHQMLGGPKLKPTSMKIYAFKAGQPIPLKGECSLDITTGTGASTMEKVYVTADENKGCILSCGGATRLHLVHLAKEVVVAAVENNNMEPEKPIGKVKGIKVRLHINPDVTPVAMPHRRIPYHLREQVEAEIKKLAKLDIIEKVSGPTPWVSPVVIVPKPNGSIRLCVDMRQPNRAIERERHLIPTIEGGFVR